MNPGNLLAQLPKVDQVLAHRAFTRKAGAMPHSIALRAVREHLEELRKSILSGKEPKAGDLSLERVAQRAGDKALFLARPSLKKVVNATGVVVHTNLGRSILAEEAIKRLVALNQCYSNLEYDIEAGARGSRYSHVIDLLKEITGAEDALVVNNNAAAVYLSLMTLAPGREVIVSRGQLVEIGGSFRIPDVMIRSGAVLCEVGATNKTHLHDYENAISSQTALLLKVHTSNFQVVGFHKEVTLNELKELARRYHLPVMEDLGSGMLMDLAEAGLPKEPTVQESLKAGADIVTFSGDKLLGGPQAGIILGASELISQLKKNPVNRALRIDKLTLAALEATLELYRDPRRAVTKIPTLRMLFVSYESLTRKASRLAMRLKDLGLGGVKIRTRPGVSMVGGGALPLAEPRTRLVEISVDGLSPTRLEKALRTGPTPIIARLDDRSLVLDVRTLLSGDPDIIAKALSRIAAARM